MLKIFPKYLNFEKMYSCSGALKNFNFTLKNRFLKVVVFIYDWFPVKFVFTYFFREVRNKPQTLIESKVNQKKIKSSRKEYVT